MSMRTSRTATLATAVAMAATLAAGVAPSAAADTTAGPTPVLLPTPDGTYQSEPTGVNAGGIVVGDVTLGDPSTGQALTRHAVRWDADLTDTLLDPLPGDSEDRAIGVDGAGTAVGTSWATGSGAPVHAVRWAPDGTATALAPLPGDRNATPTAVSRTGTVVGYTGSAQGPDHAVSWAPDGTATSLLPLPGDSGSRALGVNGSGTAVGYSYRPGADGSTESRAVIWGPDGSAVALPGTEPYPSTQAALISDTGAVFGTAGDARTGTVYTSLTWNTDGSVSDFSGKEPKAVNSTGTAVGRWSLYLAPQGVAVRWRPNGSGEALSPVGGPPAPNSVATAINDGGTVVGYFWGQPDAGEYRYATRWNPDRTSTQLPRPQNVTNTAALFISNNGLVAGVAIGRDQAGGPRHTAMVWKP
ncbi:hypothetical protein [Kitasatospora sp. NPDC093102]|uniref:hypothetical protein n=1 Tax=Kitasatospora sp. NPDC093102 TaxID=3155069 RepID=UPI0034449F6E